MLLTLVLLFGVVSCTSVHTDYSNALKSPQSLLALFRDTTSSLHSSFPADELPLRVRVFRAEVRRVVEDNGQQGRSWRSGLNSFSFMTSQEKSNYLGMNISSAMEQTLSTNPGPMRYITASLPDTKDWRSEGKVAGVKNQGKCGSCWAYAAVGPVETAYAVTTGKLKQFSEQEYVDCAYKESYDSCKGGWYSAPWSYSITNKRLATQDAAPYRAQHGPCHYADVHNGFIAATLQGSTFFGAGEAHVIQGLASGAVGAGFKVSSSFYRYSSGILADETCHVDYAYHAVAIVGYTPRAIIVKNSWGTGWGEKGYFNWARGHHGCNLYRYCSAVTMASTGVPDTDPEYVPEEGQEPCVVSDPGCVCGTVRCPDGQCRHEHMCSSA